MANHTPLPAYPYGSKDPFPHDDANDASEKIVKSPNFDEGSSHAPTGTIALSGSNGFGFEFADSFPFSGGLLIPESANLTFDSTGAGGAIGFGALVQLFVANRVELSGNVGAPARLKMSTRSRNCAPVHRLSDVSQTINATESGPVVILAQPTSARVLTIEQATDTAKENGDYLDIFLPKPGNDPASHYWAIKREGSANNIAILSGKYFPTAGAGETYPGWCRIHLEGGVWRLTGGAGINYDTDA